MTQQKSHVFQIGVSAGNIDDIEGAAEKAASAVNQYLGAVYADVSLDTAVVVSIGVGQQPNVGSNYRTTAIGFTAEGDDDFEDFEGDDDDIDEDEVIETDDDID